MADEIPDLGDGEDEAYLEDELTFSEVGLSDGQLDNLYEKGRFRLIQERNDFMLPQMVDYVTSKKWVNIRPEYQRRLRWSRAKKSALIESFLMNVPVPPIFLYESDINFYEVMDGQQRINAICEFYNNEYTLYGLKTWPALNGKNYANLPSKIRRGLDRAKISSNILLSDSGEPDKKADDIRTLVFERLNTGGEKLNAQELRNCLYAGSFNNLILEIARNRSFTDIWLIPAFADNTDENGAPSRVLRENSTFKAMKDCEVVLRFFAFRDKAKIKGSVRRILDNCMSERRFADDETIIELQQDYMNAMELCLGVFGDDVFRLPENEKGKRPLSKPLYDSVMISFDRLKLRSKEILENRAAVVDGLNALLATSNGLDLMVGRANTADTIKQRIDTVEDLLTEILGDAE